MPKTEYYTNKYELDNENNCENSVNSSTLLLTLLKNVIIYNYKDKRYLLKIKYVLPKKVSTHTNERK